jgi:NADPH2:quinone reductase
MTNHILIGKAVTYTRQGGYEVIEVLERQVRPPAIGEVRIRVIAAAVNPTDLLLRSAGPTEKNLLVVPGMDAAGIIESVGPGVTRLRPGENVMAVVSPRRPDGGAQAHHIVVPAASVIAIPEDSSLKEAATLPMNGLTALRALELAGLSKGQSLAISGGAGLLARYAIACAKRHGIQVVTDAKAEEVDLVRNYGADIVVERGTNFAEAVRKALPEGVHALLDTAVLSESSFSALRDGGVYLPVRGWADKPLDSRIKITPVFVTEVLHHTHWLEQLRGMVTAGEIKLSVAGEYAPEQAVSAQRALDAGGLRGRPVIVF